MGRRTRQSSRPTHHPRTRKPNRTQTRARQLHQQPDLPLPQNEIGMSERTSKFAPSLLKRLQSQRDCALQPRVGELASLPWVRSKTGLITEGVPPRLLDVRPMNDLAPFMLLAEHSSNVATARFRIQVDLV